MTAQIVVHMSTDLQDARVRDDDEHDRTVAHSARVHLERVLSVW
ncbi:hypothetical protein [Ilumatobacter sp.]